MIIYTGDEPPPLVPGEDPIIIERESVKVTLDPKGEALLSASRLNLAKLYTVEHNILTVPVGRISARRVDQLRRWCVEVQGPFAPLPDVGEDEPDD